MHLKLGLLLLALHSGASIAGPSVFIPPGRDAWWASSAAQGRVLGTSANGVTVDLLSKFIDRTEIFYPYKVCSLTSVSPDTFVGLDRATQEDIDRTVKGHVWRMNATTRDGRDITVQSVLYEACGDDENRGGAVLVSDAKTSEVLLFQPMGKFTETDKPIWTAFLDRPESGETDPPLFRYSHCTECGAATAVYYDVSRRKLYTEYNGH